MAYYKLRTIADMRLMVVWQCLCVMSGFHFSCSALVVTPSWVTPRRLSPTLIALNAKRKKNQTPMDDLNRWYDEVDENATPDDVFWEEIERQRLLSQIGESSDTGATAAAATATPVASTGSSAIPFASAGGTAASSSNPSGFDSVKKPPSAETIKNSEATLAQYEAYMVSDNWLDEDLAMMMEHDWQEEENDVEEETRRLEQQLEEMSSSEDDDSPWVQSDEPWDHWGEPDDEKQKKESIKLTDKSSEFLLDDSIEDDEAAKEEAAREEREYVERLAKLKISSRRLDKARDNAKAAAYFHRDPDELEGYDTMWVSAIDNVCWKNLVGVFRNYGIQFADNFGDWKDGCTEDGFATIEDVASFKARQVHEITGLPCIASRTSFEIEPVATPSALGGAAPGAVSGPKQPAAYNSPRVTSGYRFNDIGLQVDYIIEALKPLSDISRVTRFRTCLCYYDGEMEVFDYGVCDCDIYFANSLRTFIPVATAINEMSNTMQLTFGLEYQKWLNNKVRESMNGYGGASVKLRDRVLKEGKVLPNDIIDVSAFMDSKVDVDLMDDCAKELANRFYDMKPNKIVTAATTGLVIALPLAKYLQVPVVYARKERNVVMADTYKASYSSKTVGKNQELLISKSHLEEEDRCLIVDDFLSGGSIQDALLRIVLESGATAIGVGVLLEKVYESGRKSLSGFNVPVESLCRVASVKDGVIQLVEEEGFDKM